MTREEYEQKKHECWEYVRKTILTIYGSKEKRAFDYAFDRAYALALQWISVKEQLPEDLEQVLVRVPPEPIFPDLTMPGYSTIAYRDNGRWRSWMDNTCHPTHWLPIPKFNNEDEES